MTLEPSDLSLAEPSKPVFAGTVANPARVWNYWLGEKDNYAVDRRVGGEIERRYPQIISLVRYSRAFLGRAVRVLAAEVGLRQFLDIGAGLPAADNVHEVAQRAAPGSRVVYVDHDPLVLSHIRARLLAPGDELVHAVEGDLHRPERLLAAAAQHLDLSRPVGVLLCNVLGHLPSFDIARAAVRRLLRGVPAGSYLVVSDLTNVLDPSVEFAVRLWNAAVPLSYQPRSPEQIESLFAGLELIEPGVVSCPCWRPQILTPEPIDEFCGVARKP